MVDLQDHLKENLKLLFVGYNPSVRSFETGHHYASPNNRFWKILYRSGLTDREYRSDEDGKLLEVGYGFTNIVARATKTAAEISKEEYAEGRIILRNKIIKYRPKVVCYVGKGVYEAYALRRDISWGLQNESVVPGVLDFVAPSSSGLVRLKMEEIVEIYKGLKHILDQL